MTQPLPVDDLRITAQRTSRGTVLSIEHIPTGITVFEDDEVDRATPLIKRRDVLLERLEVKLELAALRD